MNAHETGGDFVVIDSSRKRVALFGNLVFMAIMLPFMAMPVLGTIVQRKNQEENDEAVSDESGSHH